MLGAPSNTPSVDRPQCMLVCDYGLSDLGWRQIRGSEMKIWARKEIGRRGF